MDTEEQLYEVEFKASRRHLYANTFDLDLRIGNWVLVEADRGEDMGVIHRIMNKPVESKTAPKSILRIAGYDDQEKLYKNREMEIESMAKCQELILSHGLKMKLVDVEYQFDCNMLTFYFTADQRVDFRGLVKDLAGVYRTRIELRQIGVRDEARRLGGLGACGLLQCCNSFIQEFAPISTQMARDQNLSLNPAKISGNCGRLLCCLQYEQTHYVDTMSRFPRVGSVFESEQGKGTVVAINVFKQYMTVRYDDGEPVQVTWQEYCRCTRKRKSN